MATHTPEEKAALEWLDDWGRAYPSFAGNSARTIKAMLSRPTLPEEPTPEAIAKILQATWGVRMEGSQNAKDIAADVYRALYAHLTAPKTKEVEVWHVEYAFRSSEDAWDPARAGPYLTQTEAEEIAAIKRDSGGHCACIRVTGPHKQTIPA